MKNKFSCTEPQNNMYISRDGLVKVCCHNHYFEIGDLKKNTLLEIWNSDKRKLFAEMLYKSSDEPSCEHCALKQPEKKSKLLFNKKFKVSAFPKSIEFELSNKCNLECIMCSPLYSNQLAKHYTDINDDSFDFKNITQQLDPFFPNLKEAKFYGGEPFIIEQYFDIWEYIIKNNLDCKFYIQTNGTILNEKIKSILNKGIFNIGVSIESINTDTYQKIRVNADLPKVFENIEYFNNYSKQKNTFFGVAICPIRSNWKELPMMVEYFSKRNIPINFHQVVRPFNVSLWNLPKAELSQIYITLSEYTFKSYNNKNSIENIKRYNDLINQISEWQIKAENRQNFLKIPDNSNIEQLLKDLEAKAIMFLNSLTWLDQSIRDSKIKLFNDKMNAVANNISDKNLLIEQLKKLKLSPIYLILTEIERISIKEITENILSL